MGKKCTGSVSEDQKKKFIGSVRTGKEKRQAILEEGMSLSEAFTYGYLDVSRTLRGIAGAVGNSKKVKEGCIKEEIVPFCEKTLLRAKSEEEFDRAHKDLSDKIREYYKRKNYKRKNYDVFTVGKTQKWINMALKYACIYANEYTDGLCGIRPYCHVPIDRYIATPIARELEVKLPEYDGFVMPPCASFDAKKQNYAWSRIDDYSAYLDCQRAIREKLEKQEKQCAFMWEFEKWLEEKEKKG